MSFDREGKVWMTIGGGGDDEILELWEIDWTLVDYPHA